MFETHNKNKSENKRELTHGERVQKEHDDLAAMRRNFTSFTDRADQYFKDHPDYKGSINAEFLEKAGGIYSANYTPPPAQKVSDMTSPTVATTPTSVTAPPLSPYQAAPKPPKPTMPRPAGMAKSAMGSSVIPTRRATPPTPKPRTTATQHAGSVIQPPRQSATPPQASRDTAAIPNANHGYMTPDKDVVDPERAREDLNYYPNILDSDIVNGIRSGDAWSQHVEGRPGPIRETSNQAFKAVDNHFKEDPHGKEADAFRHAYWSYLMAQRFGTEHAKAIGDGHEHRPLPNQKKYGIPVPQASPPNLREGERLMDLYNNRVGRELFERYGQSGKSPEEIILQAIEDGLLRTSPYTTRQTK